MFRIYKVNVTFNRRIYSEAWIDPHYEVKHSGSVKDSLILDLLQQIGQDLAPAKHEQGAYRFFELDILHLGKSYRMILVLPQDQSYIGVRNVYRRSK